MAIGDDFEIQGDGDIRHVSGSTNYTVIEFHRWLGDLMDDAQASGNDLLDITDATASERATDNLITLNSPYNIDDDAAKYLYDGSIVQKGGDEIYDGLVIIAAAGTYLEILQNGRVLTPNFWTTSYNPLAASGYSHRFMVKVRTAGADIDGRRLIGLTREFGSTYSEFPIGAGTSRGNNVMALTFANDLNNQTSGSTVAGYTDVTNTEGYRLIDVTGDTVTEPYYSEWNRASRTINQFYERMKWLSQRQAIEDSCADSGNDMALGNGTITRQGQSFSVGTNAKRLTKLAFRLKRSGTPTGNITATVYAHTGSFGAGGTPTGSALATSVAVDASQLSTSYQEFEFGFATTTLLSASTNYFAVVEFTGDASNFVQVQGDTTGTHAGNRASFDGSWTGAAAEDLFFKAYGSSNLYGIPGCMFRGITHDITVDTPTGTFSAVERVTWSGGAGQMLAINSPTAATRMWIQLLSGVAPTDGQTITGATSGATVDVNVTVTSRTLSQPFCGASTGSAIIGAYGFGIESADLSNLDTLFDLDNVQRVPPNNVQFSVGGLSTASGGDRILVGPLGFYFAYDGESGGPFQRGETLTFTGGETAYLSELLDLGTTGYMKCRLLTGSMPVNDDTITGGTSGATAAVNGTPVNSEDPRQLKLNTTLSGATETAVVCTAAIPTDTPSSGTIRIQLNTGIYMRKPYTSFSGSTFTIASSDFTGANTATGGAAEAGNSIFISYIDKNATSTTESFTVVFNANRNLFVRVRFGAISAPIKTFETSGTLTSSGGSATAIRTTDA